jgi:hypothetical protein
MIEDEIMFPWMIALARGKSHLPEAETFLSKLDTLDQ